MKDSYSVEEQYVNDHKQYFFSEIQQTNTEKDASEGKNEFDVKTVNTTKEEHCCLLLNCQTAQIPWKKFTAEKITV